MTKSFSVNLIALDVQIYEKERNHGCFRAIVLLALWQLLIIRQKYLPGVGG